MFLDKTDLFAKARIAVKADEQALPFPNSKFERVISGRKLNVQKLNILAHDAPNSNSEYCQSK